MKKALSFLAFNLLLFSCIHSKKNTSNTKENNPENDSAFSIPNISTQKDSLILVPNLGIWKLDELPYNGYAIKLYKNNQIAEKIGYHNGKKQGKGQFWYADGLLKKEVYYKKNRIVGTLKLWSPNPNSILIKEYNYVNGIEHGVQKQWYKNGQIAKIKNLENGKEVGLQQAWLKNGKQYINYEVVNGRAFGLKKAQLCYELEDEKLPK